MKKSLKNYFNFPRPSNILMFLNKANDKEENKLLVSLINSGLKDLKEEIKKMSKEEKKLKAQNLQQKLSKIFLILINKNKKDKV